MKPLIRYKDLSKKILYILEAVKPFIRMIFMAAILLLTWKQNKLNFSIALTIGITFFINLGVLTGVLFHKKFSTLKFLSYVSITLCLTIFSVIVIATGGIESEFYLAFLFYTALIPFFQLGYRLAEQIATGIFIAANYNAIIFFMGYGDSVDILIIRNFFLFFLIIVSAIAGSILTNQENKLKELNNEMNEKNSQLKEKNDLVEKSLKEVERLKEQQDGDYFLISLLTDTLNNINNAANENIKIDMLIREKKKFKFRKWNKEIGGDMCMAYTIKLRGRPYTMFLNADAMGKSIQGAGGVLVMGSILKFLTERTLDSSSKKSKLCPEKWLRNAFVELQRVFESFNGSMLMSLVLGLVDEQTGVLYFMNAEHPWCILLRDGKAEFLEKELIFHKIGTQGVDNQLWVQVHQLTPQDIVFIGSDGRDDILIAYTNEGHRVINEDENEILRRIEESNGKLESIIKQIEKKGIFTDDFSMIRIHFKKPLQALSRPELEVLRMRKNGEKAMLIENFEKACYFFEKAYKLDRYYLPVIKDLINIYMHQKNYQKALYFIEKHLLIDPADSKYLYLASYCAKMNANYKKAMDYGERLRLRDYKNVKNLINLADIYRQAGRKNRAEKMLGEAESFDPQNSYINTLRKAI